jgi:hypothetical protein
MSMFQFDPHSFCRELLDESLMGTRTLPKSQRTKTSSSYSSRANDRSAAAFDSALMLIQSAAASERPMQDLYQ